MRLPFFLRMHNTSGLRRYLHVERFTPLAGRVYCVSKPRELVPNTASRLPGWLPGQALRCTYTLHKPPRLPCLCLILPCIFDPVPPSPCCRGLNWPCGTATSVFFRVCDMSTPTHILSSSKYRSLHTRFQPPCRRGTLYRINGIFLPPSFSALLFRFIHYSSLPGGFVLKGELKGQREARVGQTKYWGRKASVERSWPVDWGSHC